MNKLTKSILIGIGVTILYYGLAYFIKYRKRPTLYKGHYIVRIKEKENGFLGNEKTVERVADFLSGKMAYANIPAETKILNNQLLELTVSKVPDTSWITRVITTNIHLEFREMYTLANVGDLFMKADELLGYKKPAPVITVDTTKTDTGGFATFTVGYQPEPEVPEKSINKFIQFSYPVENANKILSYPSSIGTLRIQDTAMISEELRRKEIINALPADAKILYGLPFTYKTDEQNKEFVNLYVVRAIPGKPAVLENSSIKEARLDYTYDGKPMVSFQFNAAAARKWERMTTDNVGKPIAIIINDIVISAPNVIGPISGGSSEISGGYTVDEARELAAELTAGGIPATATIVKKEITREKEPFLYGNSLIYLLIFLVSGGISYLIFGLLTRN